MPIADEMLEQYAADPVSIYVPPVDLSHHAIRKLGVIYTPRGGRS
jgi:hypothetical protein